MKLLALAVLLSTAYSPASALWPQPQSLQTGSSTLRLAPGFQITVAGRGVPGDLLAAAGRTKQYLTSDKLGRLVVGRGADDAHTFAAAKTLSRLTLSLEKGASFASITSEAQKAPEERDEAYHLVVPADGSGASITAHSTLGLFRGLATFGQLWYEHDNTVYTISAPVTIADKPAYVCLVKDLPLTPGVHRFSSLIVGLCWTQRVTSMHREFWFVRQHINCGLQLPSL